MSDLSAKTTIYLNPYVKKYLQLRALQESRSVSELVNDEFADLLEDFEDVKEAERRKNEPVIEWEIIKKELDKRHGIL